MAPLISEIGKINKINQLVVFKQNIKTIIKLINANGKEPIKPETIPLPPNFLYVLLPVKNEPSAIIIKLK